MYDIIFKPTSKRIIDALLKGKKSLTQLSDELELSKSLLMQKYLASFEKMGLVSKTLEKNNNGREAFYELQSFTLHLTIIPKAKSTVGFATSSETTPQTFLLEQIDDERFKEDLRPILKKIAEMKKGARPELVILYGSVAKGEGSDRSDIDIAIIKKGWDKKTLDLYLDLIADISSRTDHVIKPLFFSTDEFVKGSRAILKEIKRTGIVILGDLFSGEELWQEMMTHGSISSSL